MYETAQALLQLKGYQAMMDPVAGSKVSVLLTDDSGEVVGDFVCGNAQLAGVVRKLRDISPDGLHNAQYGYMTDESIAGELRAEQWRAQRDNWEAQKALVVINPAPTVQTTLVPGLKDAVVAFARDTLDRVRSMAPGLHKQHVRELNVLPPSPDVTEGDGFMMVPPAQEEPDAPVAVFTPVPPPVMPSLLPVVDKEESMSIREVLAEAKNKRVYARVLYQDRQGVITTRDVLVQGLTQTYAFVNCNTRFTENKRRFVSDFRNRSGRVRLPGRAQRQFEDEKEVIKTAGVLANRKFIIESIQWAELTDTPVPPKTGDAKYVCPTDDHSGKHGQVWECANPKALVESGHWMVL